MPANYIIPSRFGVGLVPDVDAMACVTTPTFLRGYPVVATAGLIDECGADPILIAGFALQDGQTNPGFQLANSPTVITGRSNTASIAMANNITEFMGPLVNGNNTIVVPANADLGASYGLTKYIGIWYVDQGKIGATARVVITDIDSFNNVVWFKVIDGFQQFSQ